MFWVLPQIVPDTACIPLDIQIFWTGPLFLSIFNAATSNRMKIAALIRCDMKFPLRKAYLMRNV